MDLIQPSAEYDSKACFWGVCVYPKVKLQTQTVNMALNIAVDLDQKTTRTDFQIVDFIGLKSDISGLGPLNWILEFVANKLIARYKEDITKLIEDNMKNEINSAIQEFIKDY